jgi:SAM-dependent methyltransferase
VSEIRGVTSVRETADAAERAEPYELFPLMFGFMQTQALAVVAKLGVADVVSADPIDVAEIADRVGAHEESLYRLLRYLATEGVFDEREARRFTATPLSNLLRSDVRPTVRWQAMMLGSVHYRCWAEALHSFVTGEPAFEHVFGSPFFDYLGEHRDDGALFDKVMAAAAPQRTRPLLDYDWTGVERVADIGGGTGTTLAAILSAHTHLHGVLVDQPAVVASAGDVLGAAGVADRCEIVAASFFTDELPSADAYVLSRILHDWDDERSAQILRNCRRSLAPDGKLLIVETVVHDGPDPTLRKLFDLHMLVVLGGKERTEAQWRELLAGERFEATQIRDGLIEARAA